ncbi:DUF397 domain-containing protein [Streptomyces umbrinus]|uniref:DUF397 domain-containing protein n=1 Tax=Streptomyces umbrinus TaxID=67370 RepID=UPI0027D923DA|nr:DUF397 domain-containing protein [Streptomyces umbrinus]
MLPRTSGRHGAFLFPGPPHPQGATNVRRPQILSDLAWFKWSYSGGSGTECVDAAFVPAGALIQDSNRPKGPHVAISAEAWARFIAALDCIGLAAALFEEEDAE